MCQHSGKWCGAIGEELWCSRDTQELRIDSRFCTMLLSNTIPFCSVQLRVSSASRKTVASQHICR